MPLKTTAQTCEECHIVIDWTWSFDNDDLDDELWDVEFVDTNNDEEKDAFALLGGSQFSGSSGRQGPSYS